VLLDCRWHAIPGAARLLIREVNTIEPLTACTRNPQFDSALTAAELTRYFPASPSLHAQPSPSRDDALQRTLFSHVYINQKS
jgi:hypothetical protein